MTVTIVNKIEYVLLRQVHLTMEMGTFMYMEWFIVYDLVKYNFILRKDRMEEINNTSTTNEISSGSGKTKKSNKYLRCKT